MSRTTPEERAEQLAEGQRLLAAAEAGEANRGMEWVAADLTLQAWDDWLMSNGRALLADLAESEERVKQNSEQFRHIGDLRKVDLARIAELEAREKALRDLLTTIPTRHGPGDGRTGPSWYFDYPDFVAWDAKRKEVLAESPTPSAGEKERA